MTLKLTRLIRSLDWLLRQGGLTGRRRPGRSRADQDNQRPPQTLPQGFESTDRLLRDLERAENGTALLGVARREHPVHERSLRFIHARPDFIGRNPRHDIQFIDFPANVGIIKGPDGKITLYDSGWKQLAYIFDWNTSCCWWDLPDQMRNIGLDPDDVTRIVIGHGHWDHAGQLNSFPNAVLYVQKEELSRSTSSSTIRPNSMAGTSAR